MNEGKDWMYQTNVYEVNLRQYTTEGTCAAFAKHLPRLHRMGVQTLWFMPLTPIAQKEKKGSLGSPYACADYAAFNPELGSLADFKSLVAEAHALGMKVIIDWVANHTGWDHVWTVQHPEWYKRDAQTGDFQRAAGMDDIIELDFGQPAMRQAQIDAMRFWINSCDIDGFRCDLADWVPLHFWAEAQSALQKTKPLFWLAEADFAARPDFARVFHAAYTWQWMHQTRAFHDQKTGFEDLLQVLHQYGQAPGMKAWFTANHDENTWNGTEYEKYGYLAKTLAVFSITWPGLPLMYSGQELPNEKRLAFFDKDVIAWKEPPALHGFYQTLLQLHAHHPALHAHATTDKLHTSADDQVLAYQRMMGSAKVVVLLNFGREQLAVSVHDSRFFGRFKDVFSGQTVHGPDRFVLEGGGFVVLAADAGSEA